MGYWKTIALILLCSTLFAQDAEKKVKTNYDINGNPVNQSQDSKGLHRVVGLVKLVGGKAAVFLNSSTAEGRQDISFIADSTYNGIAWSLDTLSFYNYRIMVRRSDTFQYSHYKSSNKSLKKS